MRRRLTPRRARVGATRRLKFPKCKTCKLEKYLNDNGICAECARESDK